MMRLVCYEKDFPVAVCNSFEQAAEFFGVSVRTTHYMKSPSYMKKGLSRYIIRVDDEEGDDEL